SSSLRSTASRSVSALRPCVAPRRCRRTRASVRRRISISWAATPRRKKTRPTTGASSRSTTPELLRRQRRGLPLELGPAFHRDVERALRAIERREPTLYLIGRQPIELRRRDRGLQLRHFLLEPLDLVR